MKKAELFEFEGQMLSASQVHKLIPAISQYAALRYLRKGMRTRQAMLSYNPKEVARAASIAYAKQHPLTGFYREKD